MKKELKIIVRIVSFVILFTLLVPVFAGGSKEAAPPSASKRFAGKTISLLVPQGPHTDYLPDLLPAFKEKTGITVEIDKLASTAHMTRLNSIMMAKGDENDLVYIPQRFAGVFIKAGWVRPLDQYLNDKAKTRPDFNLDDFLLGSRLPYVKDGALYGIPNMMAAWFLFYNKDMFAQAGLTRPPENMAELEEWAAKLNKPDQAGIVLRAKREGQIGSASWIVLRLATATEPSIWFDKDMKPLLNSPGAVETTKYWVNLLNKYGPRGVSAYGWEEAAMAFELGKAAMIIDDQVFGPSRFEDPKISKIAGKVGYSVIPGKSNQSSYGAGFAWGISSFSREPEAAWEFIQYITTKESFEHAVKVGKGGTVPRKSVLSGSLMANTYNPEWIQAVIKGLATAHPESLPLIPEGPKVREQLAIAIDRVLNGSASAEAALKEANEAAFKILEEAGYYKK
jgi:ABC-type glycerol-3-phosphate transport system substrate-binding protein